MPIDRIVPPPAPRGPTPTGAYEYLVCPPDNKPNSFENMAQPSTAEMLETAVQIRNVPLDGKTLINRTRVYRVPLNGLWSFQQDVNGPYLAFGSKVFRFSVNDPSLGTALLQDWTPVW